MSIVRARGLTRRFGSLAAVDDVSFDIEPDRIYGLLGRNGAGKTTLMQLLTGQDFPTAGSVEVLGESPVENPRVLADVCFIKESQKYPDEYRAKHIFAAAPWFFRHWDDGFAQRLIADFGVPLSRPMKKLSRGQLSAVGVIIGLASRAPLTFFDEPYLGLDAVARQLFYDALLEDYAAHPRTVVLSTHLIDEISRMLEHVIVIDHGGIIIDSEADALRASATSIVGGSRAVEAFVSGRTVLDRQSIGALSSVTVEGALSPSERAEATAAGIEFAAVSLQQLVVQRTAGRTDDTESDLERSSR